jgi:hypothetical protein
VPTEAPKLRIEYRDAEGKSEAIGLVSDLDDEYNAIYDLLYVGNEVWVSLASGEPFSKAMINYVIEDVVENASEDGWPLVIRTLPHSIMFKTDFNAAPFGLKAYKFYKKYAPKSLENIFNSSQIMRFEKMIKNQKKSAHTSKQFRHR